MRRSPSVVLGLTACYEETSLADGKIASSYARSIPFIMGGPWVRAGSPVDPRLEEGPEQEPALLPCSLNSSFRPVTAASLAVCTIFSLVSASDLEPPAPTMI